MNSLNPIEQLALAWQALLHTVRQILRPALWAPFAMLGGIQLAVVAALWWFAHPWLSWAMAPFVTAVGGAEALHYPAVFRLMPGLYARVDLWLSVLVGAVATGAATLLFAKRFAGEPIAVGEAIGHAVRRAPALILATLPLNLLALGFSLGLERFVVQRGSSGLVLRVAPLVSLAGVAVLQALFLYVAALVMLSGRGWLAALAALPTAAARGLWAALFLSAGSMAPHLPALWLGRSSSSVVERGVPEIVGALLVFQIASMLVAAFLLTGSATLVYQTAVAPASEETR